jgi:arginine/lysine/histidine/glutamine transport system substrate-binding and permease protein
MSNKFGVAALVVALIALGVALFRTPSGQETSAQRETAFQRVMRTRTLRCAYAAWPPYFMIDPNTRTMSGINYEIMEAIGTGANLKIDWQEESGYGIFPDNLRSGKQDAFCSGVRLSAARAQRVEPTAAVAYAPLYAYVRNGDTRFDGKLDAINDEKFSIAIVDGSTIEAVAKTTFPKAKSYALPQMSDEAQVLDAVAAKKADVVFTEASDIVYYNKSNPAKQLRRVEDVKPLRTLAAVFAVAKGEWELRDLLNSSIHELYGDGTVDRILAKYEVVPGAILPVATPYRNNTIP